MLKALVNEARFALRIETMGPLLVKSGHATIDGPDMAPVRTFRDNTWQYYIPGSSLKGVVRSHLEKIVRTLSPGVVCNPFLRKANDAQNSADINCGARIEQRRKNKETILAADAYAQSCPACRLFGSTAYAGRASFSDAYAANGVRVRTEIRDGVGIDRLTGGSAAKMRAKFDLQAVSVGEVFTADVLIRNFECWQLGALFIAVSDFEDNLIRIGSGRSRGLGAVRGTIDADTVVIHTIGAPSTTSSAEVWGIGRVLGDGSYGTIAGDVLTTATEPERARHGVRLTTTYTEEALQSLRAVAADAFIARMEQWPSLQRAHISGATG